MRAQRKKAPPIMTPRRWAAVAAAALLLAVIAIHQYYRVIQQPVWNEEREASARAKELAGLTEVLRAEKVVWDETFWIVKGIDGDGEEVWVWLRDRGIRTVKAAEAVSPDEVKERVRSRYAGADIVRIRPGLLQGEPAWEVFYSLPDAGGKYFYDFYDFKDGTHKVTYRIPGRTAD